jgi:hypothetical protein
MTKAARQSLYAVRVCLGRAQMSSPSAFGTASAGAEGMDRTSGASRAAFERGFGADAPATELPAAWNGCRGGLSWGFPQSIQRERPLRPKTQSFAVPSQGRAEERRRCSAPPGFCSSLGAQPTSYPGHRSHAERDLYPLQTTSSAHCASL